jgi:succinate dehydrogenase/fumarate reductase flavoprotein subunit
MKRNRDDRPNLSRRNFVRTTATSLGAAAVTGLGAAAATGLGAVPADAAQLRPTRWDREADVVVIGGGACGLPAAITAVEHGASVILVDAHTDVGGHAIVSNGNVALGGGTSRQKKYGIEDSPDLLFRDLTDWSVVEPNGFPDYRYNDREVIRAYADNAAPTFEFLVEHGVIFVDRAPDNSGADATGNSAPREHHAAPMGWIRQNTGLPWEPATAATSSDGVGLIRPLEAAARKLGVQILLEHRMTGIIREQPTSGRVLGIAVTTQGRNLNIHARKGVIIATGGHSSNVNFRRIFDPRMTEEYQVAGEPLTKQDASGEIAAMALGASLWGAYNQVGEFGQHLCKAARIGCQYGYGSVTWMPTAPIFSEARAIGLTVRDWQNVIMVNQAGLRFYDETGRQFSNNNYNAVKSYRQGSYLNAANVKYAPANFLAAAMAGTGDGTNGGGPIWAIFDADAVDREHWTVEPPYVDIAEGYFASANTIADLAGRIVSKYQRTPMPPGVLEETVARYNTFVDAGQDADFGKPSPKYKVAKAPFYAAWATPIVHDSRAGLRINGKCQVVDLNGNVIPGLYCGGESAGGFSEHGLARCTTQGRLAGMHAAAETTVSSKA